ncbi:MAG TPA: iron transporter [Solirubrobacteraceae bacterium]|nr:iron transporter [Solirubrobacteraceae bacterium]
MRLVTSHPRQTLRSLAAVLVLAVLAGGCAAADKTASTPTTSSSSSGSMAGMNMGSTSATSTTAPAVDGIKPVPTQVLAKASWQEMKITAQAMTAVPFVIFNGTNEQLVKPGPHTSFHLMVMLNDAETGVPIPYAGVWATITKAGKIVYDERQWPMISRYMGPHYGNDVSLPGAGTYKLSLLISPPVSARHVEYQNIWLKPHRVTLDFHWQPTT